MTVNNETMTEIFAEMDLEMAKAALPGAVSLSVIWQIAEDLGLNKTRTVDEED